MEEVVAQEEQEQTEPNRDETPEYGAEAVKKQDAPEEEVQSEPVAEEVEEEQEPEETPPTNWEKRYKDLESSHSRRGNEVHTLKQERDDLRYQKLEMQQKLLELEELRSKLSENKSTEKEPDPYEDDRYWSDDEKEILKEYPEIAKVAEKFAKREAHKAEQKLKTSTPQYDDKLAELEKRLKEQNEYISRQQAYSKLDEIVGPAWREVDNEPEFHEYVNGSKIRYKIMVQGDLEEKAEVFQDYLAQRKIKDTASPTPPQTDDRRKAAQGLMKGQPPKNKAKGELSIDELWASIPDPE